MPIHIEIQHLYKSYKQIHTTVHVLEDVSLVIERGDIYGIIGMSGAGKSTLIRALSGLVTPTSGQILYSEIDIAHMDKQSFREFRKKIGMIFQHFNLLSSRTVAENIAYPLEIANMPHEARVDELLQLVGLSEKKNTYPLQLSGGEKQRVAIARALATHPEVLLCDEATSALDPKTTQEILNLLKSINKNLGVTICLITHEMDVIKQICNKVAVIDKGAIVESGLVSDVFADPKHMITKYFLQHSSHDIPQEFFTGVSPNRKLLRLQFKGQVAGKPLISTIVRKFDIDANILMGWIDRLQTVSVGTLIIELTGNPERIAEAIFYLEQNMVHCEVVDNEC